MALIPCNVCGTLNSEDAEICLSCEYPIKGRRRPAIFQWAAIVLFILFTAPLVHIALNFLKSKPTPRPPQPPTTTQASPPLVAELNIALVQTN